MINILKFKKLKIIIYNVAFNFIPSADSGAERFPEKIKYLYFVGNLGS